MSSLKTKFKKDTFGETYVPIICPLSVFLVDNKDLWIAICSSDLFHYLMERGEWIPGTSKMEEKTEKYWGMVEEILLKGDTNMNSGMPYKFGFVL